MDDEREIATWLAELAEDEAPIPAGLRATILDGLPAATAPHRRPWWQSGLLWGTPAAAALCGLWLGVARPALVLDAVPGAAASWEAQDALDEWEGWL